MDFTCVFASHTLAPCPDPHSIQLPSLDGNGSNLIPIWSPTSRPSATRHHCNISCLSPNSKLHPVGVEGDRGYRTNVLTTTSTLGGSAVSGNIVFGLSCGTQKVVVELVSFLLFTVTAGASCFSSVTAHFVNDLERPIHVPHRTLPPPPALSHRHQTRPPAS